MSVTNSSWLLSWTLTVGDYILLCIFLRIIVQVHLKVFQSYVFVLLKTFKVNRWCLLLEKLSDERFSTRLPSISFYNLCKLHLTYLPGCISFIGWKLKWGLRRCKWHLVFLVRYLFLQIFNLLIDLLIFRCIVLELLLTQRYLFILNLKLIGSNISFLIDIWDTEWLIYWWKLAATRFWQNTGIKLKND